MEVLGLSEVRWFDFGELKTSDGLTLLYSGWPEEDGAVHRDGVGILLTTKARQSLMDWKPVSERIITARFNSKIRNISVIQCYAPTEVSEIEKKDEFYALLAETVKKSPKRDLIIIMGDFNAKVGPINEGVEHVMGTHGEGQVNDNGERFINFCDEYELVIGGTIFPHKRCHKVSWVSPDNATENQIDHIAISRKFRGCLTNVRNKRGADVGSDHHLIMAEFRMKIMTCAQKFAKRGRKFDLGKLQENSIRGDFRLQLQNRFEALQMTPNVDIAWGEIQEIFTKTSEEVLGIRTPKKRSGCQRILGRKLQDGKS
ncbi:craniofacial development protein 2-like [Nilaparvata lugens]|uniref:craniofacial development protein 2-like n=1 Tax=Nilaparvata lugens TaxID=108931 RepID=UPI00193DD1B4|nr:craniofacial development protein 2-like [Nilaparvata lugens]